MLVRIETTAKETSNDKVASKRTDLQKLFAQRTIQDVATLQTLLRAAVPAVSEPLTGIPLHTWRVVWTSYDLSDRKSEPELSKTDSDYLDDLQRSDISTTEILSGDTDFGAMRDTLLTPNCREWLGDDVINDYTRILDRIYGTDTTFFIQPRGLGTQLQHFDMTRRHIRNFTRILRWIEMRRQNGSVRAFFPMNVNNHWIIVKVENADVLLYDSFPVATAPSSVLRVLQQFFKDDLFLPDASDWEARSDKNVPKQRGGVECGIAALLNMRSIVLEEEFVEAEIINDYRRLIALEIIFSRIPYSPLMR